MILLLVTVLCACVPASVQLQAEPEHALMTRIEPAPALYREWWAQVQHCTGVTVPLDSVVKHFYWYQAERIAEAPGGETGAAYFAPDKQVWIATPFLQERIIVMHELVHAALLTRGIMGHPPQYFARTDSLQSPCGVTVEVHYDR